MSAFRDSHAEFAGTDAQVLGISMDDLETQTKFADSLKSPFPLLSDAGGKVTEAYGIVGGMGPVKMAKRVTFVIGKDGKVTDVFEGNDAIDPTGALGACKRPK
jgi:thioredoxin-dependent peroxiredoxin